MVDGGTKLSELETKELETLRKKLKIQKKHNLVMVYENIYVNAGRKDEESKTIVKKSKELLAKNPGVTAEILAEDIKLHSLDLLQSINPNFTIHKGNPDQRPFRDCYFTMKKLENRAH